MLTRYRLVEKLNYTLSQNNKWPILMANKTDQNTFVLTY